MTEKSLLSSTSQRIVVGYAGQKNYISSRQHVIISRKESITTNHHSQEVIIPEVLPIRSLREVDINAKFDEVADIKTDSFSKGFGRWTICRTTRKKVYISLTGQRFTGSSGVRAFRSDQQLLKEPSRSSRGELISLVEQFDANMLHQSSQDLHSLPEATSLCFWGVPTKTVERYRNAGVKRLFDWQLDCLLVDDCRVLRGGNLIYTAPTSGGKTLVAEVLMLRRLAMRAKAKMTVTGTGASGAESRGSTILFVVPFIALVEEKADSLRGLWTDMRVAVKVLHSEEGDDQVTPDTDVCVCTIEKANMLLNKLLEGDGGGVTLSMIVVDELHMIADKQRGFLLEVLLSKVLFAMGSSVQIVGMSATMPNVEDLSTWIKGSLYRTTFRPVTLQTLVCCSNNLYSVVPSSSAVSLSSSSSAAAVVAGGNIKSSFELVLHKSVVREYVVGRGEDDDGFISLCIESVANNKSVLLFCPSKSRTERCCQLITAALLKYRDAIYRSFTPASMARLQSGRHAVLQELQQTPVGVCATLLSSLPEGVAYHHAGLIADERRALEQGFRQGFIAVLCTTSTLSAGVNLPAHRVVIRDCKMGAANLTVAAFRQMCGRAGRFGYNETGEAILHIRNNAAERQLAGQLCLAELDPLVSSLHAGCGGGVEKLVLDMVSCQRLQSTADVEGFIRCTLMSCQHPEDVVKTRTAEAQAFLLQRAFVTVDEDGRLHPTQKGCATAHSGISPLDADEVLCALEQARRRFVLKGGFHAVYLVTPLATRIVVNWAGYETILSRLLSEQPELGDVLTYIGVSQQEVGLFRMRPPKHDSKDPRVCFYKRIYNAIILFSLIQEKPITRVAEFISSSRGDVQQLQKDAAMYCGMVTAFARRLNWTHIASILESYSKRLCFGVRDDILPLVRMGADMPAFRARAFYGSGLLTPLDIARAGVAEVCAILADCAPFDASNPLEAIKARTRLQAHTSISSSNVDGQPLADGVCTASTTVARQVNNKTMPQQQQQQYERLARRIQQRAREIVEKDMKLLLFTTEGRR